MSTVYQSDLILTVSFKTSLLRVRGQVKLARKKPEHRTERPPELVDTLQTETTSVLFPALKIKPGEKLTKVQAAVRRSGALKLVYRNLLIQYAALGLGTASFAGIALYMATTSYATARTNNIRLYQFAGNLAGLWNSVLFGVAIIGAVVWRSFDPAFILGADVDVEETELRTTGLSMPLPTFKHDTEEPKRIPETTGDSTVLYSYATHVSHDLEEPARTQLTLISLLVQLEPR